MKIMKTIKYPDRKDWEVLLQRPSLDQRILEKKVRKILNKVKEEGDKAIRKYTKDFDGIRIKEFQVSVEEIESAIYVLNDELKQAISVAKENIRNFHLTQLQPEPPVETMPGVKCWRRSVGIEKVGLYIPGGSAPLFSTVLMLGIPAQLAGCREIILCTPPRQDGSIDPAILYSAHLSGIHRVFKMGGAQAIAAMAFGTESVPGVYKIFGPGNQFVTCAKQLVQSGITAIDMPAGPSEVCVLADDSANPVFVAADLLSQAEHGADSQVILVTNSEVLAEEVVREIKSQLKDLPRKKMAVQALKNSKAILLENLDDMIDFVNEYAAEHLIIACERDELVAERILHAGSVFLGNYSPESAGDYASGTNHTLPTNGYAKAYSGVSVDSFVKKITCQKLSRDGIIHLGPIIETLARAEGLEAHARAVSVRFKEIKD